MGKLTHKMHIHQHKFPHCCPPLDYPPYPVRTKSASLGCSKQTVDWRGYEKRAQLNYDDIQEDCKSGLFRLVLRNPSGREQAARQVSYRHYRDDCRQVSLVSWMSATPVGCTSRRVAVHRSWPVNKLHCLHSSTFCHVEGAILVIFGSKADRHFTIYFLPALWNNVIH